MKTLDLDAMETIARAVSEATPETDAAAFQAAYDRWADVSDPRYTLALIANIREIRAGLVDALYWLKPGFASQEDRAEEMARDRAELSKLLDKEIEIP